MATLAKALSIHEKYYKVWDNKNNKWFRSGYSRKQKWATKAGASNAIGHHIKHLEAMYKNTHKPVEYDLTIVEYKSTGVINEIRKSENN